MGRLPLFGLWVKACRHAASLGGRHSCLERLRAELEQAVWTVAVWE
jgi:hypothetical protein